MKILLSLALMYLVVIFLAGQAPAQDATALTDQQRLNERFDDSKLPKSTFDADGPAAGEAIGRDVAEKHRFTLSGIRFAGMTIYDAGDMRPIYGDMIGTEISLAKILDVAESVEEKYERDGYTTADVELRRMPSADGKVTLSVTEKY
jgi:hemolysin activation/secretion protein